jgi:hypothetical protein
VVVYRHCAPRSVATATLVISLFLDIGQGAGLAGATGIRPFLPPLVAGALARGDAGVDFERTDYAFLESPAFLAAVLGLAVIAYAAGRARGEYERSDPDPAAAERATVERPASPLASAGPLALALAALSVALGALLFAGSLADGGHAGWPGLVAGAACAVLGYAAGAAVFGRARRRLDRSAAALLPVWADAAALAIAAASVLLPPLGIVALVVLAWPLFVSRREGSRKYAGLRVLR